jgi:tetratricopeptide (TPR) repeat protein
MKKLFIAAAIATTIYTARPNLGLPMVSAAYAEEASKIPDDPLAPTKKMLQIIKKAQGLSEYETVVKIHEAYRANGLIGIKYKPTKGKPQLPEELEASKVGDCSDLSYAIASAIKLIGIEHVGAFYVHIKGTPKTQMSLVPFAFVKGGSDANAEEDSVVTVARGVLEKAAAEKLKPGKGMKFVLADPTLEKTGYVAAGSEVVQVLDMDGIRSVFYNELGNYFLSVKDGPGAEAALKKAKELDKGNKNAGENLGMGMFNEANRLVQNGKLDEALEMLRKMHKESPNNREIKKLLSNALSNQGVNLYNGGNHVDAMKSFKEALEIDPENKGARKSLKDIENQ